MSRLISYRAGAMLAVLPLLLAAPASTQDTPAKYLLKEALPRVGDVATSEQVIAMDMEVAVQIEGSDEELPKFPVSNRSRERFTESVLKTDSKGPSLVKRTYLVAREQSIQLGQPQKIVTFARQGKTLTFSRTGSKVTVTPARGKLPADELAKLKKDFVDFQDLNFFPKKEVSPGEEWTVDPRQGKKLPQGLDQATVSARFEEVVPFQGRQCARIRVTLEMSGKAEQMPLTIRAEGDLYHDLELQRTLSAKLAGPVTMNGTLMQEGKTLTMDGTGTFTMSWTSQFAKAAGKPLPRAKPAPATP